MHEIAAYKGKGRFYDRLIRWWTGSQYSHVEIVISRDDTHFKSISASPRDGGVRSADIKIKPNHWDFFPAHGDLNKITPLIGRKYDWKGILLSQILPLRFNSQTRYFCSELAAIYLGLSAPQSYSPQDIVEYLRRAS